MFSQQIQELVTALTRRTPAPSLTPSQLWNSELDGRLRRVAASDLFTTPAREAAFAQGILSGLHLWNDNLSMAHALAMSEDAPASLGKRTLDYWHGIMHRREPDYPNAKYWFRRVGAHPLFPAVLTAANDILSCVDLDKSSPVHKLAQGAANWDAYRMIDLCEQYAGANRPEEAVLQAIQAQEMALLLEFCAENAVNG